MKDQNGLLICGGVAAGTAAASRARRTDRNLKINLYEKDSFISYSA
jgi:NADPH-dependent 2,4-dienoyl-CoA reductase/sulfur reductase-like enzyme